MKVLLITPWFGPLPQWWPQYERSLASLPYDVLHERSLRTFKNRVNDVLGIKCPIEPGSGKIHDFRPAFGKLFESEIAGYDFWGHTDFDCVYGRMERFYTAERLAELDILSDGPGYIGGPWTLYRNDESVNSLFYDTKGWKALMEDSFSSGWIEKEFTWTAHRSGLRVESLLQHGFSDAEFLRRSRRKLMHFGREIPFFHFKYTKRWPALPAPD